MSLLIKALEQAAKDRKAGRAETAPAPAAQISEPVGGASTARPGITPGALEPTLEPPPPPRSAARTQDTPSAPSSPPPYEAGASRPQSPLSLDTPQPRRAPTTLASLAKSDAQQQRARAASVLQAGAGSTQYAIAWLRANPVMMLGALAMLFGIGFGLYVYLQIAHPGMFSPSAAPRPRPANPSPASTATAPPAPVPPAALDVGAPEAAVASGSPVPDSLLAPAGTQPVGPAASSGSIAPSPGVPADTPAPLTSASLIGGVPRTEPAAAPARESPSALRESGNIRAPVREQPRVAQDAGSPASPPAALAAAEPPRERIAVSPTAAQPRLDPTLAQAYTLMQSGNLDEARALYTRLNQSDPLNIDVMLGLAYIAAEENRTDEATRHYVRILQLNPRHAIAQAALIGLMGRADAGASETRLKQLIARDPSPFLHFVLGNLYADQSQWAQAQQAYFRAHQLEPANPDYAYNLAVGLDHLRQGKIALNFYRRAEQLAATQGRSNFDLAHARERIRILSSQIE